MDDWGQGIPLSYTRKLAAGQLEARCLHRGPRRPGEHCTTTEYTSLPHRHRGLSVGQQARWHRSAASTGARSAVSLQCELAGSISQETGIST
jgi:hypothetical protein